LFLHSKENQFTRRKGSPTLNLGDLLTYDPWFCILCLQHDILLYEYYRLIIKLDSRYNGKDFVYVNACDEKIFVFKLGKHLDFLSLQNVYSHKIDLVKFFLNDNKFQRIYLWCNFIVITKTQRIILNK